MVPAPQGLPTRFPCWVRAVYSWGGESKRDLGFIEGDLIECLNAGDGSWWMGRLRRDKRMMGLFPSNFVEVLDDSFRPASRASSPMPDRSPSPNPELPQKVKTKAFRKPFTSYAAPDEAALKRAELRKQESILSARTPSPKPRSVHDNIRSVPSPDISGYGSRAPSSALPMRYGSRAPSPTSPMQYGSRAPSPAPPMHYGSRAQSPAPSFQYRTHSRGPSLSPEFDIGSSPPPPPPPHRTTYTPHRPTSSYERSDDYHTPWATSPHPPSPGGGTGLTPSPLRSAMDDVMSSLADMGVSRETESPEAPLDPWSPEAFDQTYAKARRNGPLGPNTAMGISQNVYDGYDGQHSYIGGSHSRNPADQPPPQLSNYVQRMEKPFK